MAEQLCQLKKKGGGKSSPEPELIACAYFQVTSGGQSIMSFNASDYRGKMILTIGCSYNQTIWEIDLDNNLATKIYETDNAYKGRTNVTCSNKQISARSVTYGPGTGLWSLVQ